MSQPTHKLCLILVLTGLVLGSCARQEARPQPAVSVSDDDAICQAKGLKPGSDAYVGCRRDRDHLSGLQAQQGKQDLRKIQDYMMDNK